MLILLNDGSNNVEPFPGPTFRGDRNPGHFYSAPFPSCSSLLFIYFLHDLTLFHTAMNAQVQSDSKQSAKNKKSTQMFASYTTLDSFFQFFVK